MPRLSRRSVLAGIAAFGGAGLASVAQGQQLATQVPQFLLGHGIRQVSRVLTPRNVLAMTFDDGPHPENTPVLLDILRVRGLKATFYLIGSMVARYPDVARRIAAEGHEIGNHTWRHPYLSSLSDDRVLEEIDRTTEVIWQTTGMAPHTMRPPYGAITGRQIGLIYAARNLPTVMWSVDTMDWRRPGSTVVAERVVAGADRGAIILAHDIHAATINAMPSALDGVMAQGFSSTTMSDLLGFPMDPPPPLALAFAPLQ